MTIQIETLNEYELYIDKLILENNIYDKTKVAALKKMLIQSFHDGIKFNSRKLKVPVNL